jgi:hypothetical protein
MNRSALIANSGVLSSDLIDPVTVKHVKLPPSRLLCQRRFCFSGAPIRSFIVPAAPELHLSIQKRTHIMVNILAKVAARFITIRFS